MAVVIPGRGGAVETARILLELADSPSQVATSTQFGGDKGVAFVIPDDLHEKYIDHLESLKSETGSEEPEVAPKRRPGRPKKVVEE